VQRGYWSDKYITHMVQSSGQKRQPEINRGVYLNIIYAVLDLPETELQGVSLLLKQSDWPQIQDFK